MRLTIAKRLGFAPLVRPFVAVRPRRSCLSYSCQSPWWCSRSVCCRGRPSPSARFRLQLASIDTSAAIHSNTKPHGEAHQASFQHSALFNQVPDTGLRLLVLGHRHLPSRTPSAIGLFSFSHAACSTIIVGISKSESCWCEMCCTSRVCLINKNPS